ncbi:hypothetical protein [Propionivibrio sp.]|uniref:hypothetical protein n=1 Tax=Propionivibrio sp. TaxID=2212460 RepID=UPI0025FC7545|nr:hypothetical protein [Propionivibrio sp.]
MMNSEEKSGSHRFFPAIVCGECDSPVDALVALCVARDEAMDLVAASWPCNDTGCILAVLDGGRTVAAIRTPEGRWAACNAFLGQASSSRLEAERNLQQLIRRGRRGYVGMQNV